MLHKMPIKLETQPLVDNDEQIIRSAIIAEYDAINLYEQFANSTNNESLKIILRDVANEEKVHVGEFERLLDIIDIDHQIKVIEGSKEVEDKLND
jgi:rubrerythrin